MFNAIFYTGICIMFFKLGFFYCYNWIIFCIWMCCTFHDIYILCVVCELTMMIIDINIRAHNTEFPTKDDSLGQMGPIPWEYIIAQGTCLAEPHFEPIFPKQPHVPRELGPICPGNHFLSSYCLSNQVFSTEAHLLQGMMFWSHIS